MGTVEYDTSVYHRIQAKQIEISEAIHEWSLEDIMTYIEDHSIDVYPILIQDIASRCGNEDIYNMIKCMFETNEKAYFEHIKDAYLYSTAKAKDEILEVIVDKEISRLELE